MPARLRCSTIFTGVIWNSRASAIYRRSDLAGHFYERRKEGQNKMFEELEKLCKGLNFISESDAPVEAVRGSVGFGCRAETADFEQVVDNQIRMNEDWQPLKDFMTAHLTDLKIFKVGRIELDVYGVGYAGGELFGFKTKAVET